MSTSQQDDSFGRHFLEDIVTWVAENMDPEDVFDGATLEAWARGEEYTSEADFGAAAEIWAKENGWIEEDSVTVEHLGTDELDAWAEANGWTKDGEA